MFGRGVGHCYGWIEQMDQIKKYLARGEKEFEHRRRVVRLVTLGVEGMGACCARNGEDGCLETESCRRGRSTR